jgi:hypothetical protein
LEALNAMTKLQNDADHRVVAVALDALVSSRAGR